MKNRWMNFFLGLPSFVWLILFYALPVFIVFLLGAAVGVLAGYVGIIGYRFLCQKYDNK